MYKKNLSRGDIFLNYGSRQMFKKRYAELKEALGEEGMRKRFPVVRYIEKYVEQQKNSNKTY